MDRSTREICIGESCVRRFRIPEHWDARRQAKLAAGLQRAIESQQRLAQASRHVLMPGHPESCDGGLAYKHAAERAWRRAADDSTGTGQADDWWWLARGTLRALAAGEQVHGGLHAGALLIDPIGRVRVTDFGVSAAYRQAAGEDLPTLHLAGAEDQSAHRISGTWEVLPDHTSRSNGWLATLRAPEQLVAGGGLSSSADQFALGVTLFVLASNVHPLGVPLDEPNFVFHPTLEPYDLLDCLKADAEHSTRSDSADAARMPALSAFLSRLMASDPGGRFSGIGQALAALEEQTPAGWDRIETLLERTADALAAGRHAAATMTASQLLASADLPPVVRQCVEKLEAELGSAADESEQMQDATTSRVDARLVLVLTGPGVRAEQKLPDAKETLTIGRGRRAVIRIDHDRWVSREHVRITCRDGRLFVTDLQSRHGTRLNGRRLHGTRELHLNDELRFGMTTAKVVTERGGAPMHQLQFDESPGVES